MSEGEESPEVGKFESPVQKDSFGEDSLQSNPGSYRDESQKPAEENAAPDDSLNGILPLDEKELQTENCPLLTEKMEVHHHPQVEKKGLKEYVLEGLMIFIAVTMGFFAETMRDNISESGKAKELAKSLYQEVYADSVSMQYKINVRLVKENQIGYFKKYVRDSSLVHLSDKFYPSFLWAFSITSSYIFDPNDGIINQLRNSGMLRYFKSIELQNSISNINVAILNIRGRNIQENAFVESFTRPFLLRYYDFDWEDEYKLNGKTTDMETRLQNNFHPAAPPVIRHINDFSRDDANALATNYLQIIGVTRKVFYSKYIEANHRLLQALRKEYNFTNE